MTVRSKTKNLKDRAADRTKRTLSKVPGPSNNPATNLIIMDIAMRGASMIAGRAMEKALLRTRYHPDKAHDIVQGRTMVKSMAANGVARVATRSLPGFIIVTGGLLAKAIFDRSLGRRKSVQKGEAAFADQAAKAED
ncbi:MAG: hypothetical protein ABIT16_11595 [Croceibacterium sp.]